MMQRKNTCKGCEKEDVYIANAFHSLCVYCNQKRLQEGKERPKRMKQKSEKQKDREQQVYEIKKQLFRKCKGRCQGCNYPGSMSSLEASHIIPKSLRNDLYTDPKNIHLHCRRCHTLWEHHKKDTEKYSKLLDHKEMFAYIYEVDEHYYNRLKDE